MHIYVGTDLTAEQCVRLREIFHPHKAHICGCALDDAPINPVAKTCEVAFGNLPANWIQKLPALRWVQLESVGFAEYAPLDWAQLGRRITVTNMAGFFTDPVAETVLAGILGHYRGTHEMARLQAKRDWRKDELRAKLKLLRGAAVLLAGFGLIARRIRQMLEPFGCQLTSFARQATDADLHTTAELEAALPHTDIVIMTLPQTPQTVKLFDARRLDLIRHGALIVNVGRGTVVDENALVQRLRHGHLGGAVIDTTVEEPLPDDHPLWTCPNTILTQHTAGGTANEMDRKIDFFHWNLRSYCKDKPLKSVVDWQRGY